MLEIQGREYRLCDGATRRSFLKIGSLGIAGLTLPHLLRLRRAQAAGVRSKTSVILFWLAGGPSHIDMVDMKPDAAAEVRGPFQPIDTNLPGLQVCELMPRHARIADKLAVIRSLHHNLSVHDDGSHWLQTGHPLLNARQRGQQNPSQGSVVACVRGPNQPGLPPYVCIPEDYRRHLGFYEAAAFLSSRYNAVNAGGNPSLGNYRPPDFVLPPEISLGRLEHRRELLRAFDHTKQRIETSDAFRDLNSVAAHSECRWLFLEPRVYSHSRCSIHLDERRPGAFAAFAGEFLRRVEAEFAAAGDFVGGVVEHVGRAFGEEAVALRVGVGAEAEENFAGVAHVHIVVHHDEVFPAHHLPHGRRILERGGL